MKTVPTMNTRDALNRAADELRVEALLSKTTPSRSRAVSVARSGMDEPGTVSVAVVVEREGRSSRFLPVRYVRRDEPLPTPGLYT